jgi:hypothetical protein
MGGRFMVLNAIFNNISIISWWSVLLEEETGVPGENHRPAESHWQTSSHNVGLYTATKTLAFASYFCKMRIKKSVLIARRRVYIIRKIFVPLPIIFFNLSSDSDYPVFYVSLFTSFIKKKRRVQRQKEIQVATQTYKKWGWVQESKHLLSHSGH